MEVELHDGTVLEFPDGTSMDVVKAAAKRYGAAQPTPAPAAPAASAPAPFQRAGDLSAASAGVAESAIRGATGIKQLNDIAPMAHPVTAAAHFLSRSLGLTKPRDTTEEQAVLREMQTEHAADPEKAQRFGGNVVGNVLATAVPMSRMSAPTSAMGAIGTGAAVSGATGMVLNPGEGETTSEQAASKLKQSGVDALFGGALSAGGQLLKKTLTQPFRPSGEAQRLMDEGMQPTLAQGAAGRTGRTIGKLTSGIVDVSGRQNAETIRAYLRRVAPNLDTEGMTVPEMVVLLERNFQGDVKQGGTHLGEYGDVLDGKTFSILPKARQAIHQATQRKGMQPEAAQMAMDAMAGTGAAMQVQTPVRMGSAKLAEYRALMQDAIKDFGGDGVMEKQTKEALIRARKAFDQLVRDPSLTREELSALREIDGRYSDFLRFADAAKSSTSFHTKPTAGKLLEAYRRMDSEGFSRATSGTQRELLEPANRVMGLSPNQDEARSLVTALRRTVGPAAKIATAGAAGVVAPAIAAPVYGLSALSQTRGGAAALMGNTQTQKDLAMLLRRLPQYTAGAGFTLDGNGEQ